MTYRVIRTTAGTRDVVVTGADYNLAVRAMTTATIQDPDSSFEVAQVLTISEIISAGRDCAKLAIAAGGMHPFDERGQCLLPTEPLDGDLEVALDKGIIGDELRIFEAAFEDFMSDYIAELVS